MTDTDEYYCMYDTSPLTGMCSGSRDLFKYPEITDMLEMVQNRDIVAMED